VFRGWLSGCRFGVPDMSKTTKRTLTIIIVLTVVVMPWVLLSNPVLAMFQNKIDSNADKDWAPVWQLRLAKIYMVTLRADKAAEAYGRYLEKYNERYDIATVDEFVEVKYQRARCLEDSGKFEEARDALEELIGYYQDHPEYDNSDMKETINQALIRVRGNAASGGK
jgi:tetratricopeptide (TPR) repeat protein